MESEEQITINKILYIGSGIDLNPIKNFPNTKEFVYVDTLPRSEWDDYNCMGLGFHVDFNSENFIMKLCDKCIENDFEIERLEELDPKYYKTIMSCKQRIYYKCNPKKIPKHINPHLMTFVNRKTGQIIKYYFSTNIEKNMNSLLSQDIIESDALIVSGHWPRQTVLHYFHTPKIYIGYSTTTHSFCVDELEDYEKLNVVSFLHETTCSTSLKYFNKYYLVVEKTGEIIQCRNIKNLEEKSKHLHSL